LCVQIWKGPICFPFAFMLRFSKEADPHQNSLTFAYCLFCHFASTYCLFGHFTSTSGLFCHFTSDYCSFCHVTSDYYSFCHFTSAYCSFCLRTILYPQMEIRTAQSVQRLCYSPENRIYGFRFLAGTRICYDIYCPLHRDAPRSSPSPYTCSLRSSGGGTDNVTSCWSPCWTVL
jgi:hypothetical protein